MRIVFAEAKLIKHVMNTVASLVDDARVVIDKKGLSLDAISLDGNVAVSLLINRDAFLEYDVVGMENVNINLRSFNMILHRANNTKKVIIVFEDKNQYILLGGSSRKYTIPQYDVMSKGCGKLPVVDYGAVVEFEPKILAVALRDVGISTENITFEVTKDTLYFSSDGYGTGGSVVCALCKEMTISFEVKKECKSTFLIEYLKDIVKANGITGVIRLSVGNDTIAKLDYLSPVYNMSFMLTPITHT